MTVVLFIFWGMISYLACRVAYIQGRKDKWEDMSRNYICIHKDVKIRPTIDWAREEKPFKKNSKKHLTKRA